MGGEREKQEEGESRVEVIMNETGKLHGHIRRSRKGGGGIVSMCSTVLLLFYLSLP